MLKHWGLESLLLPYATHPKCVNLVHWKGEIISSLDFIESASKYPGTCYWDFHRANLHYCLIERTKQLGGVIEVNSRVIDINCSSDTATAVLQDGRKVTADLIVGADGINSRLREIMLGKEAGSDPPTPTGDLAYRLLLSTKEMMKDPELATFVTDPQVNYWLGPDKHAVNYVLRGGELFNMVRTWRKCLHSRKLEKKQVFFRKVPLKTIFFGECCLILVSSNSETLKNKQS